MNHYLIEPRDSLIVRDGKPFDNTPGSRANTLDFPFPSTIIGTIRTRAGLDEKGEFNNLLKLRSLQKVRNILQIDSQFSRDELTPQDIDSELEAFL